MQTADRGMSVPGAVCAVFLEQLGQPVREFGQIFQWDGAVLNKGNRLSGLLHRHHDVQTLAPNFPDGGLQRWRGRVHHRIRITEISHQHIKLTHLREAGSMILTGKLDHQNRAWLPLHEGGDHRFEDRNFPGQFDHVPVDQLDRVRLQGDDMLGRVHRLEEGWEMADAHDLVGWDTVQLQLDLTESSQCPFGADQQARHIMPGGIDCVDVVAADPAHESRKSGSNFAAFAVSNSAHFLYQIAVSRLRLNGAEIARHRPEMKLFSCRHNGVYGEHIIHHNAVMDRPATAGIIRRHAAKCGPAGGRDIDREEQAVRFQRRVQMIKYDARLNHRPHVHRINLYDPVQMLRAVEHKRIIHRLPALAGTTATRQQRHAILPRDLHGGNQVGLIFRDDDADRLDLIN